MTTDPGSPPTPTPSPHPLPHPPSVELETDPVYLKLGITRPGSRRRHVRGPR